MVNNYLPYPQMYPQVQYVPPVQQPQIQPHPTIVCDFVQNKQCAAATQNPVGTIGYYVDIANPYIYKKEYGADGKPLPMETFRLVKEEEQESVQADDLKQYVRADEIGDIVSQKVEDIVKDEVERRLSEYSFKPTKRNGKVTEE